MSTSIDALHIRRTWGRDQWLPPEPFGPDGWSMLKRDRSASIIVSCATHEDGTEWVHASIARDVIPTYEDLVQLHASVWKHNGWAYQVFAPASDHVNIHEHALHLWGRLDGKPALPNFGAGGSI